MSENFIKTEAARQAGLSELESLVRAGGDHARDAFGQLTTMATGGYGPAQKIVDGLDRDIAAGRLTLPPEPQPTPSQPGIGIDNLFFTLTHPLAALKAKIRQIEVSIDHELPPAGSTIETFPELPLRKAAAALRSSPQPTSHRNNPTGYLPPDRDPGDF